MRRSAFLDASVLFAAGYSQTGAAYDLSVAGTAGRIELIASRYVLAEVVRNLTKKAPRGLAFIDDLITSDRLRIVDATEAEFERVARIVERKDAPVVAAAMAAGVPIVATYDRRHLLDRAETIFEAFGVKVLTPDEVLRRLAADDEGARP